MAESSLSDEMVMGNGTENSQRKEEEVMNLNDLVIQNYNEMVGLTVERVFDGVYNDELTIRFTDGRTAIFTTEDEYYDGGASIVMNSRPDTDILRSCEFPESVWKPQLKQENKDKAEAYRLEELRTLDRLKKKYEGGK